MELNYEQEYWRDQEHKQRVKEAEQLLTTDAWYRLNGMVSPYTIEEIKVAEKLTKDIDIKL